MGARTRTPCAAHKNKGFNDMLSNKAPLEKKRIVASLQSLAGAALSFLLIYPEQTLTIWSWLTVLVFALFFLSGWALPQRLFKHPLFDLSLLALTSTFFAFAISLNPSAPWSILLLYYFLLYAVTLLPDGAGRLQFVFIRCLFLLAVYLLLIGWHGRNMLKEGLGLLVGVPSFTALAGLYVYLLEQVRWEREKAEAREKVRTEVVAALAHDIKQPLTSILGYVEILLSRGGDFTRQAAERIRYNSELIFDLVLGFLDVAKLEAAGPEERAPVELKRILNPITDDFRALCGRKAIDFSASLPDLPPVMGNRSQLDRLFRNLLSNAVKFTSEGGRVTVRGRLKGENIEISVEDTGEGISKQDLPLLFGRFKRFGKQGSDGTEGTGIGLFIAKAIVESHGGGVSVQSEPGHGALFTVTLPCLNYSVLPEKCVTSEPLDVKLGRLRVSS